MAIGKTKAYSTKEFEKILSSNGFEFVSSKGDHKKYRRGVDTVVINDKINKMVCRRLIKENNLKF